LGSLGRNKKPTILLENNGSVGAPKKRWDIGNLFTAEEIFDFNSGLILNYPWCNNGLVLNMLHEWDVAMTVRNLQIWTGHCRKYAILELTNTMVPYTEL